jgi:hypothetical protein
MKVRSGSLLSVPYSNELNDIGVYIRGAHKAPELYDRVHKAVDTLLTDVPETARVLPTPYTRSSWASRTAFPTSCKFWSTWRTCQAWCS